MPGSTCNNPECKKNSQIRGLCWTCYGNKPVREKYADPKKKGGPKRQGGDNKSLTLKKPERKKKGEAEKTRPAIKIKLELDREKPSLSGAIRKLVRSEIDRQMEKLAQALLDE